jgi:leucyl/phenylalanyl-tRNA---protein transferase
MLLPSINHITPDPYAALWHYANGRFPHCPEDRLVWADYDFRGVQFLDQVHIPSGQKRYVFSKKWEVRFDTAFEQVLNHCAAPRADEGSWITDDLKLAYLSLHRLGFAHSYEAWESGRLVAGAFGVHIGSFITVESMFHLIDHAGKAAYVRTLLHLRDCGFTLMDVNIVSPFFAQWGAVTIRRWKFDSLLNSLVTQPRPFMDGQSAPALPSRLRAALRIQRFLKAIKRRITITPQRPQAPCPFPVASSPH